MTLLRLQTLATGRTGVRPATAQAYVDLLNAGITPVVRSTARWAAPAISRRWRTSRWR